MLASHVLPSRRARKPQAYAFVWDDVATADSYKLQVGTTVGSSNRFNSNVGNVLTIEVSLPTGIYYSRVLAYNGASLIYTSNEQIVTVA